MERMISVMKRFGYTESESKAYISLLQNGPQTGYELSKLSGVARSKIYNVLEMLVTRGVVVTAHGGGKSLLYKAEPVERLIGLIQLSVTEGVGALERESRKLSYPAADDEQVWKLFGEHSAHEKCVEMISQAKRELLIQIWATELDERIEGLLLEKEGKLNLLVVLYDDDERYDTRLKHYYRHGFINDKLRETGYRWFTVVADGEQMIHAAFHGGTTVEAVYTRNAVMVLFAAEHVRHDAYCLKLIDAFPEEMRNRFGDDMEEIRDVFAKGL